MGLFITLLVATAFLLYTTGINNSANAIATVVATRQLPPRYAVLISTSMHLLGGLCGSAVAVTVTNEVLNIPLINDLPQANALSCLLLCGVLAAVLWNLIALRIGLPSSATHALMGGLCGSAIALTGTEDSLMWYWHEGGSAVWKSAGIIWKVILPLLLCPILGYIVSWVAMTILNAFLRKFHPVRVNSIFGPLQVAGSALVSFGIGMNTTPKFTAIFLLALISANEQGILAHLPEELSFLHLTSGDPIPFWLLAFGAIVLAFGTTAGGRQITRNIGTRVVHLKPVSGFVAQASSGFLFLTMSLLGVTLSTSHISTAAIIGAGTASNLRSARGKMILKIICCWLLNFPSCFILGYLFVMMGKR